MQAMADDLREIKAVKYRYLRALDTKDWDTFADTLTDDVVGNYGSAPDGNPAKLNSGARCNAMSDGTFSSM